MLVVKTQSELQEFLNNQRIDHKSIGFVPTMGALHDGHLSLIKRAKSENEVVVCSIFVNPTQFNDPKDLEKYPRPIEMDIEMLETEHCDVLFLPEVSEMYSTEEIKWTHSFGEIESAWEGKMRPGHFAGVGQIVLKLLKLVLPTNAYFGQKDFQQTVIIKKLCEDFHIDINIIVCPIIREPNGLAMSSRNIRLTSQEREEAGKIYESLTLLKDLYETTDLPLSEIKEHAIAKLQEIKSIEIEYLEIVDRSNMLPQIKKLHGNQVVIIAVRLGNTRLIDNMLL